MLSITEKIIRIIKKIEKRYYEKKIQKLEEKFIRKSN